jgi:hypothetical protein
MEAKYEGLEPFAAVRWDRPKQTIFGFGDGPDKVFGDCVRCCVAAVLRLPAHKVPHFVQIAGDRRMGYEGLLQEWLGDRGMWLFKFELNSIFGDGAPFHLPCNQSYTTTPVPLICCGPTVRSKDATQTHAVVTEGGRLVL